MSDKTVVDEILESVGEKAAFELTKPQALEVMKAFAEHLPVGDTRVIHKAMSLSEGGNYAPIARMLNEGLEVYGLKLKPSWGVVRDWYSDSIEELKDCATRMGNDPESVFYLQDGDRYMARLTDWR